MEKIIGIMWSKMSDGLRSRTRYGGTVEGEGKKDDEVVLDNVTNDVGLKSSICEDSASNGSSDAILVPGVKVEKETIACEAAGDGKNEDFSVPFCGWNANGEKVDGVGANDCNGELVDGVDANNCNGDQADVVGAKTKGRRGRKQKNLEVSSVARRVEMFDLNEMPVVQLSARVLRSRSVTVGAYDLFEGDLNDVDEETNSGISEVDEKRLKLENIDDKSAGPNNVQCKGRRGRKRKNSQVSSNAQSVEMIDLNEEPVVQLSPNVLRSRTVGIGANDLVEGDLNDVDEEKNEGIDEIDKKKLNLENVEDKSAEPNNVQKKGRRGRKRKNSQVSSNAQNEEMIDLNQEPVVQLSERVLRLRTVGGGANDLVEGGLSDVDEEKNEGIDEVDKKKLKLENVEDRSPEPSNVLKKGRRGRKKKNSHVSNSAQRVEMIDLNEEPVVQLSARVLRSRTVAVGDNDLVEVELNDVDDETNEGIVEGDTETPKLENVEDKSVGPDNVHNKGRRGRKRKNSQVSTSNAQRVDMIDLNENPVIQVCGRALRSRTVTVGASDVVEGDLSGVHEEKDEGIYEVDKNILNLENVEDKSADPSIRRKRKKNHRGRSPNKVNVDNTYAAVIIVKKDEDLGSKASLISDTSISKLKGESGVTEKKDIRNQIVDMIVRCGWKIILVPRTSRDYNDPVYVNPEGKTHWSITKAYKNLKERIDSGEANVVEQAGFTVIPNETLSKLFRVITKKRSDFGNKRSEEVKEKEPAKNRAPNKKTDDSNCEEKSTVGKKTRGRKRKSDPLEGRKEKRVALLARGPVNRCNLDDNQIELYKKKCNLLSWMIDLGTVPEGATVQYRDPIKEKALLEGKVTHAGLSCNCCNEVHTILGFQLHAGSKSGKPLNNIYLGSELSLFQCMVDSWSQQVELSNIGFGSVDEVGGDYSDDTCNMCGDGGDLMCCDCCPSTFHLSCLDIENVPAGDWHCMYCTCKFCGAVSSKALKEDGGHHLITCQLCEEKFHSSCTKQTDSTGMNSANALFCGAACQKIFNRLEKFVGVKHEMEGGLSWTILRRYDIGNETSLSDYPLKMECNAKLAVAYSVMDECFLPVVDTRSQFEMINNVVYNCGSNYRRLNYSGFHTFILERGDEVVSAACIRFHGAQLAEMPFIATCNIYRRQGLSRQLVTIIEQVLSSMDIQKLIIPAVSVVKAMWTESFGFVPLEETTRQEMKNMSVIVFPGTDMLQKALPQATGSESEPSVPEVKPMAGADDDSEEKQVEM